MRHPAEGSQSDLVIQHCEFEHHRVKGLGDRELQGPALSGLEAPYPPDPPGGSSISLCRVVVALAPIVPHAPFLRDLAAAPQAVRFVLAPRMGAPVCVMLVDAAAGVGRGAFRQGQAGCLFGQEAGRTACLHRFAALAFGLDGDCVPMAGRARRRGAIRYEFGLIDVACLSSHGRTPWGIRVMQYGANARNNSDPVASVGDKYLIDLDLIPRYICDFDTRFALCSVRSA